MSSMCSINDGYYKLMCTLLLTRLNAKGIQNRGKVSLGRIDESTV